MTNETGIFDYSHGSSNTYTVSARHNMIPPCVICREFSSIKLDGSQYYRYFIEGDYIQNAFPNHSAEEREHIMSGIHPECWNSIVGDEDGE